MVSEDLETFLLMVLVALLVLGNLVAFLLAPKGLVALLLVVLMAL